MKPNKTDLICALDEDTQHYAAEEETLNELAEKHVAEW